MRGSTDWQVKEIFKMVDDRGSSKHAAKAEARENGAGTWAEVGKAIGVHGNNTFNDYLSIGKAVFQHAKDEFGKRDITQLTDQHIQSFLVDRIEYGGRSGDGVERATFDKYAAGVEKLEQALNKYSEANNLGKTFDFNMKEVRVYAAQELGLRNDISRAYVSPKDLVIAVPGKGNLVAKIAYEGGCRISEISTIREDKMYGLKPDPHSGVIKGWCDVKGKGGKVRTVGVSPATYSRIEKSLNAAGKFTFDHGHFRGKLEGAAARTNQSYNGPHGLRWSWAQERHQELQRLGMSYEASLSVISKEMGHERSDITCHYLH